MEEKVLFTNFEGKDYLRTFANITYISQSPTEEVAIDFYEEYVDSIRMLNILDEDEDEDDDAYNDDPIYVKREKKVSIMMSKSEAIFMARRIMERFGEGEESELEGDED